MTRSMTRHPRRVPPIHAGAAAFCLITLLAAPAWAQDAPGMDGRALDANPQVGSGGVNTPAQQRFFNTANLYVTGNVTGGRAFQGVSPIRDTSAFAGHLPTAGLGTFTRDTIGLPNVVQRQSFAQTNPFFYAPTTVTQTGAVSNYRGPLGYGASGYGVSSYHAGANPLLPASGNDYAAPYAAGGTYGFTDIGYGHQPADFVAPSSSIYNPTHLAQLRNTELTERLRLASETTAVRNSATLPGSVTYTNPLLQPATTMAAPLYDPYALTRDVDRLSTPDPFTRTSRTMADTSRGLSATGGEDATAALSPAALAPRLFQEPQSAGAIRPTLAAPSLTAAVDPSGSFAHGQTTSYTTYGPENVGDFNESTNNTYARLDQAVAWLSQVESRSDFEAQLASEPTLREQYDEAVDTVRTLSSRQVASFAAAAEGKQASTYLTAAEAEMRAGRYYHAAALYELAVALEPDAPLVRLGQAHALLAAGEYLTALHQLTSAVEAYPAFGYLGLNLTVFVPNIEDLDLRRADLERRLDDEERYELRFLLGYIEYFTGLEKFGVPNLQKAAAAAPAESFIARFPEILQVAPRSGPPQTSPPADAPLQDEQ